MKGSSRQSFREVSETIPGLVELLTLSEWCRETLPANVNSQEEKSTDAGGTGQALMARAGGAQGNPAQRALQASERANPNG
jgi:hypothetical protein